MTAKEVLMLLTVSKKMFGNFSMLELNEIKMYIDSNFKTDKGTYSFFKLAKVVEVDLNTYFRLMCFHNELKKRKRKKFKSLGAFIRRVKARIERQQCIEKGSCKRNCKKLELKDKEDVLEFVQDLKKIKEKYLIGSNKDFIEVVSEKIDTGYSSRTLTKFFYT